MPASSFVLELLDSEAGHVLHVWELGDGSSFQIGRARDCDVVLSSPVVSRAHACLHGDEQGWELSAISRAGVFVDGVRTEHLRLEDGLVFQLAERGPLLRFRSGIDSEAGSVNQTICFDTARTPLLMLDEAQRDREVAEIADGDYFQELQRKAARLRARQAASTNRPSETDT